MLKLDIEPGVIVEGEEMALTRLITNLLDNAFKFVPAGGTVWLVLRKGPKLVVSDDGPGVPEDQRETVFEKFSRGERPAGAERSEEHTSEPKSLMRISYAGFIFK